jgi:hypothetical protein
VEQQLVGEFGALPPCTRHRDAGGDRPADAVARHGESRRVAAEVRGVLGHPGDRPPAVDHRRREPPLRGPPIVDGDDDDGRAPSQFPTEHVVGLEVAEDPAPAVEVHDHRVRAGLGGAVNPERETGVAVVADGGRPDAPDRGGGSFEVMSSLNADRPASTESQ